MNFWDVLGYDEAFSPSKWGVAYVHPKAKSYIRGFLVWAHFTLFLSKLTEISVCALWVRIRAN